MADDRMNINVGGYKLTDQGIFMAEIENYRKAIEGNTLVNNKVKINKEFSEYMFDKYPELKNKRDIGGMIQHLRYFDKLLAGEIDFNACPKKDQYLHGKLPR